VGVMELRLSWLGSDDDADFDSPAGAGWKRQVRIKARSSAISLSYRPIERKLLVFRGREPWRQLLLALASRNSEGTCQGCDDGKRLPRGGLGEGDDDPGSRRLDSARKPLGSEANSCLPLGTLRVGA
jgi:hypothetical protein